MKLIRSSLEAAAAAEAKADETKKCHSLCLQASELCSCVRSNETNLQLAAPAAHTQTVKAQQLKEFAPN